MTKSPNTALNKNAPIMSPQRVMRKLEGVLMPRGATASNADFNVGFV